MKKLIPAIALVGLVGCTTAPVTNQLAGGSQTILALTEKVNSLQKSGAITNEQEDAYLDRLKRANAALREANDLVALCKVQEAQKKDNPATLTPACDKAAGVLIVANEILIGLNSELK